MHEPGEEGESLLSLACSAGYYELAEVLLRMRAGVEDRGLKGQHSITTHDTYEVVFMHMAGDNVT